MNYKEIHCSCKTNN